MKKSAVIFDKFYLFEKIAIIYAAFSYIFMVFSGHKVVLMGSYPIYLIFTSLAIGYIMLIMYAIYRALHEIYKSKVNEISLGQRFRIGAVGSIAYMRRYYFNLAFLIGALRCILAVVIVLIFFCNLKQIIPIINSGLFDKDFFRLDTILHFGLNPTVVLINLFKSERALYFIDAVYMTFSIKNVIIPLIFIIQQKSEKLRNEFFTALCLCWIVGGLSYYLFPALGPCYYRPDLFAGMNMPIAKKLQQLLMWNYINLRSNPGGYIANNFYGIAAMPSLHIAIVTLFLMFSKKLNKILFIVILAYLSLMFVGSIVLGWHYAIDAYVGVLLAVLLYYFTTRIIGA